MNRIKKGQCECKELHTRVGKKKKIPACMKGVLQRIRYLLFLSIVTPQLHTLLTGVAAWTNDCMVVHVKRHTRQLHATPREKLLP